MQVQNLVTGFKAIVRVFSLLHKSSHQNQSITRPTRGTSVVFHQNRT